MTEPISSAGEYQFGGFDRLMPFRVREILLVASPYDAYVIAEDDRLTELIISEYQDLNLRYAPRVTRVSNAAEALKRLKTDRYDLIITMSRVGSMETGAFAKAACKACPDVHVVLLAHNLLDVERLTENDRAHIDRIFLWSGDVKVLLAIIKSLEDRRNIDEDLKTADVQTILLVEDSVRFASYYLPLIYSELMLQTQGLISESVNLSHKMLRKQARPKILHARTYEEGMELYLRYRKNMLALITDIRMPADGKLDPEAGLRLVRKIREDNPELPVLLQSSDVSLAAEAKTLQVAHLRKDSPLLQEEIRRFLIEHCGFGDFVFRLPDMSMVGSVPDLHSMVALLETVPDESLLYHAERNHFSKWLLARTEFALAHKIGPHEISEFKTAEELRRYLIRIFKAFLRRTEMAVVSEFSDHFFSKETPFVHIGGGSLGGKGRGLAFLNSHLSRHDLSVRWEGVRINVPNATVLASDVFDAFMSRNSLHRRVEAAQSDDKIREIFLQSDIPAEARRNLKAFVKKVRHPLAVRSSSLLEDSAVRPFAGVYDTHMLPNNHKDPEVRLEKLERAVKLVYASTFLHKARTYLGTTAQLLPQEKMSVIIQRLVGSKHGDRFYPTFSGVAQSYNYYPIGKQKPEEGICHVALGLGETIVKGGLSLSFSPAHPKSLYQFSSVKDHLHNSQREFIALDMSRPDFSPGDDPSENLLSHEVAVAEEDGTLTAIGSTYSPENDRIYEGVSRPGTRLVTFAGVLQSEDFPLASILEYLFELGSQATGSPVEMEFAVDLARREFAILQMRPMLSWAKTAEVKIPASVRDKALCYSPRSLGHGRIDGIRDVVFVKPESFDTTKTKLIAREIAEFNAALAAEGRGYALIGPGRWGSADPLLGIPVTWDSISTAKLIVESTIPGFIVEPSFGTHFLHNVIAFEIGYLTVRHQTKDGRVDWRWLHSMKVFKETDYVRHLRFDEPLEVRLDGRSGQGAILKPKG